MLKKRIIGVITVRDGWAVQSISYRRYLPLGRPEVIAENLDRWGVDEILIQCIDRSSRSDGPDLALLARISRIGLSTPVVYVGGIRSAADAVSVVQAGAERVGVDSLLHDDVSIAASLAEPLGAQAVVAVLPLAARGEGLAWLDHRTRSESLLTRELLDVLESGVFSEALLMDWHHEGCDAAFDMHLLSRWPVPSLPLVVFGGLSDAASLRRVLEQPTVVGAAVGNSLNYREHAVQKLRHALVDLPVRSAQYESVRRS